ncbi:putative PLP-dependent enzyme possibly involved in cell wall biogenesis [Mycobacteroides abscessus subsp. abscessus]|nr:putative PLP-dependent enzyme possibly involved in cell wall biogenesis [Mycobacteroides abscessus subsp. abscessus]
MRLLRNQGMEKQYANEVVGLNNRMTDVHAAIGRVQLTKVLGWTATRRANAAFLDENLQGVITPKVAPEATHVYHGCGVYYPIPNHRLETFKSPEHLEQTERAAAEVISLPVHPSLSQDDLERIVTAVNAAVKAGA